MKKIYNTFGEVEVFNFPKYKVEKWRMLDEAPKFDLISDIEEYYVIQLQFLEDLQFFIDRGVTFSYEIFSRQDKYIYNRLKRVENIPFTDTSKGGYQIAVSTFSLNLDTELSIKVWFNLIDEKGDVHPIMENPNDNIFGLLSKNDHHISLLKPIDVPTVEFGTNKEQFTDKLVTNTVITERKSRSIALEYVYSGSIMVSIDGVTMSETLDYTRQGKIITFNDIIPSNSVITVTGFVENSSTSGLAGESYLVGKNSTIKSREEVSSGVFFDKNIDLFGIMLTKGVSRHNDPILVLNGTNLAIPYDYYVDAQDNSVIYVNGLLLENDLVSIYFVPEYETNEITDGVLPMSIMLENPILNEEGTLVLEMSSTSDFRIIEQALIPYVKGENNYNFELTYEGKGVRYIRLVNKKHYTTVLGEEIKSEDLIAYSSTYKFIFK